MLSVRPAVDFFGDLGMSLASSSIHSNVIASAIPVVVSPTAAQQLAAIDPSHTSHFDLDTLMGDDDSGGGVGGWGDDLELEIDTGNKKKGGKKTAKTKLAISAVPDDQL